MSRPRAPQMSVMQRMNPLCSARTMRVSSGEISSSRFWIRGADSSEFPAVCFGMSVSIAILDSNRLPQSSEKAFSSSLRNHSDRRRPQRELREQLRPLDNASQCRRLECLLRNHDRIAWIHFQLIEFVAPESVGGFLARHRAICTDDEHVFRIRITVRTSSQMEIGAAGPCLLIQK